MDYIDDPSYQDITPAQIQSLVPDGYNHGIVIVVDDVALASDEMPLLIVDVSAEDDEYPRVEPFRVIVSELWSVENNISISNMDLEEFADSVDEDGIFRGFPE